MKIKKGQYGYRNQNRKQRFLITAVLAAAIVIQLLARYFTANPSAKNILTVMAILTVLPMANMASPLLASWKYRTPPQAFYERVRPYEERCRIIYDLVVTTKEFILPIDAAVVHPNGVCAYCTSKSPKLNTAKAEKAIQELFRANKVELGVKLILDEHSFLRRLDNLKPMQEYEDDGSVDYAAALLKTLSM
ncbi:MAG: O-linked GlcNAc transferase-like protein [Lachnospiraceae bacterium]|nr:O-linked GlcNAc transferase-like protein [Lachnospiraceae bacterium]